MSIEPFGAGMLASMGPPVHLPGSVCFTLSSSGVLARQVRGTCARGGDIIHETRSPSRGRVAVPTDRRRRSGAAVHTWSGFADSRGHASFATLRMGTPAAGAHPPQISPSLVH